jgi:hypothetical protein
VDRKVLDPLGACVKVTDYCDPSIWACGCLLLLFMRFGDCA